MMRERSSCIGSNEDHIAQEVMIDPNFFEKIFVYVFGAHLDCNLTWVLGS